MGAVVYEKKSRIALFTLNRPEVTNALGLPAFQETGEAMQDLSGDPGFGGITTRTGKKAFSAGGDIRAGQGVDGAGTEHAPG